MKRRSFVRGATAGLLTLPAVGAFQGNARAAGPNYRVAVCEQNENKVFVFERNQEWLPEKSLWTFQAPYPVPWHGWQDLSDVKFRKTKAHGWVALVCASGGSAGIIDMKSGHATSDMNDALWEAMPKGNPHAIERIPHNGSIVVASARDSKDQTDYQGYLTMYSPRDENDPRTLERTATPGFDGAHGLLWDPDNELLWAIGRRYLRGYRVLGKGLGTTLEQYTEMEILTPPGIPNEIELGHDLMADYADKYNLLMTTTNGAYEFYAHPSPGGARWNVLGTRKRVKSLTRHSSGELVYVATHGGSWWSDTVFFSEGPLEKGWPGARFYKARIWTPDYD